MSTRRCAERLTAVLACAFVVALPLQADEPRPVPPVEEDYVLHCSACHGADGEGVPGRVPGLGEVAELARLPGGRDYIMRVPGAAQAPLDDARLARLLGWVVKRFGGDETAAAFSPAEVGEARRTPWRDPARARAAVLEGR